MKEMNIFENTAPKQDTYKLLGYLFLKNDFVFKLMNIYQCCQFSHYIYQ